MYEVLTSPITLLCLGIVFLLISLLFFYFKRSISLLERAQMEQARVLQSFITNMEMSRHNMIQSNVKVQSNEQMGGDSSFIQESNQQSLIDVSDDSGSDNDGDSDSETVTVTVTVTVMAIVMMKLLIMKMYPLYQIMDYPC
jgi:Flp pilus assembly protein TadG